MSALLTWAGPYILAGLAAIAALWRYGASKTRAGRDRERIEAKEKDQENANEIRDSVERDLLGRVREYDESGWRD